MLLRNPPSFMYIWIIIGIISTLEDACSGQNENNNELLCYVCDDCAKLSSTVNIRKCNADYFRSHNVVDDDNEIEATVVTIPTLNIKQTIPSDNDSNITVTEISMDNYHTTEVVKSEATPIIDVTQNKSLLYPLHTTRTTFNVGSKQYETNDNVHGSTERTSVASTLTSENAKKSTESDVTTVTSRMEIPSGTEIVSSPSTENAGIITRTSTVTTKLQPISPISPELVVYSATKYNELENRTENSRPMTTESTKTLVTESKFQVRTDLDSTLPPSAQDNSELNGTHSIASSKNYKPSKDFRIRSKRLTSLNITYHCFKLQTNVNGSTITRRGCAVATGNFEGSSICNEFQYKYENFDISHCQTCTESECNGNSVLNLSLGLLFFTIYSVLH